MNSRFQNKLQRSVNRKMFVLIAIGCLLFAVGLYSVNYGVNESNATQHLQLMQRAFIQLHMSTSGYLENEKTDRLFREALTEPEAVARLSHSFYQFNVESEIGSDLILMDEDFNLVYSSFDAEELNLHRLHFNEIVAENAKKGGKHEIYNATYYFGNNYSSYVFMKPVAVRGEVVGYASVYLSGSEWNYELADYDFHSVIADDFGNVIISSRKSFVGGVNKFKPETSGRHIYEQDGNRYWLASKELPYYDVVLYALVYYPKNNAFFFVGMLVIIVLGILWFQLARNMNKTMAEKNAESINTLVREIKIIRKKDSEHRIQMDTEDEFSEVAVQINRMLDRVKELNEKNTQLLELNNMIELKQLTAQFNPHFLYNTLEIIRCHAVESPEAMEDLIAKLTKILRYSIDNSVKDARLVEDMKYVSDYLAIQKVRYGDRFSYSIDITDESHGYMVPKLLLQPIIENSIKYGFQKKMEIRVQVRIFVENGMLCIAVEDDGPGLVAEMESRYAASLQAVENDTEHNGLHNIARRLRLSYGEGSKIVLENRPEEGLVVWMYIMPKDGGEACIG